MKTIRLLTVAYCHPERQRRISNILSNTLFLLFVLLTASRAFSGGHVVSIEEKQLPEFLFHWMDKSELSQQWRLDSLESSGKLPIPFMTRNSMLKSEIDQLSGKPGLFTWHHPITGMRGGPREIYGNMLLAIETTRQPVKVLTLETGRNEDASLPDFSDIDIIFHRRFWENKVYWEEWIILKPEVAKSFTVNPEVTKEILKPIYEKMKQGYQFTYEELHFKRDPYGSGPESATFNIPSMRPAILASLEEYFVKTPSVVPPIWLKRSDCFDMGSMLKTFLQ